MQDFNINVDMISSILKVVAFFTTTAVAVPYTTALLCNVAYGWPLIPNRYRRAFSPRKVYALNLAVIQQMILVIRFLPLYLQFRSYYKNAAASEILKDTTYGRNNQKLDLHFPKQRGHGDSKTYPVVVFVYGGAWSSGNKKMYGLVCSAIANRLGVIVCCPDLSRYPLGHVDDMVDDLVDCVTWLYNNVEYYSGDKSNIMMLGHSSGAHLCFMSVYEFCGGEQSITSHNNGKTDTFTKGSSAAQEKMLEFKDKHFARGSSTSTSGDELENSESSRSFVVIDGTNSNNGNRLPSRTSQKLSSQISETGLSEGSLLESDLEELMQVNDSSLRYRGSQSAPKSGSEEFLEQEISTSRSGSGGFLEVSVVEEEIDDSDDNDSVVTVVKSETEQVFLHEDQISITDIGKSVKAVIGLAGVYHIADHFQHESKRGVEDISSMTRAMYGPEQFDRFSPTYLYDNISQPLRLPKVVLLHGTDDHVVPLTSTTKFVEVLQKHHSNIIVRIIPNCDHYEICLDLNCSSRKYHETLMSVIDSTAKSVFS